MKRSLLGLSFLLFFPTLVFGAGAIVGVDNPAKVCGTVSAKVCGAAVTPAASSCSYVHCNGFEAQTDDDDWTTVSGTPDFDDLSWGMEGLEGLEFPTGNNAVVSIAVTARAETWITFMLRFNDNNESLENLVLLYNDSTLLGTLLQEHDALIKVQAEGGTLTAGETVAAHSSIFYLKLRFKQGTGANAELEFWACTDGQTWTQNLSSTDGTSTAQVNKIVIQNTHDNEVMWIDNFMENSADITDAR